jgi:RNA 2',3'-cyclic 3'-phosphodiesterase
MKRLFFALWPDADTRKHIQQIQQCVENDRLQKTRVENFHVTLLFLGNIDAVQEQQLVSAAAKIQSDCVQLCFDTLAFWRKPGILCLTASQQSDALLALVEKLQMLAYDIGIETEERPYKAHVTLARKAKFRHELDVKPFYWQAEGFVLAESTQSELGVAYRVLHRWSLTAC